MVPTIYDNQAVPHRMNSCCFSRTVPPLDGKLSIPSNNCNGDGWWLWLLVLIYHWNKHLDWLHNWPSQVTDLYNSCWADPWASCTQSESDWNFAILGLKWNKDILSNHRASYWVSSKTQVTLPLESSLYCFHAYLLSIKASNFENIYNSRNVNLWCHAVHGIQIWQLLKSVMLAGLPHEVFSHTAFLVQDFAHLNLNNKGSGAARGGGTAVGWRHWTFIF